VVEREEPIPPHRDVVHEEMPIPQMIAVPARGAAGDRIEVVGGGFVGEHWRGHGTLWLVSPQPGCELVAVAENDVVVGGSGHLTGGFEVPETGTCGYDGVTEVDTAGLDFYIAYHCSGCFVGRFTVLPGDPDLVPDGTDCGTHAFSHGDVATAEVYADGLSCTEARPVLVEASRMAPLTGSEHVDSAGFSCDRVGQSLSPPQAAYQCTKGSQTVWVLTTGRS